MIETDYMIESGIYKDLCINRNTQDIYKVLGTIDISNTIIKTDFMVEIGTYKDLYINRDTLEIYKLLGDQ